MNAESLYTMIYGKVIEKKIQENLVLCLPVFCPNTGEHGGKKPRIHGGFM